MASLGSTVDNAVGSVTPAALGGGRKIKSGAKKGGKAAAKGGIKGAKLTTEFLIGVATAAVALYIGLSYGVVGVLGILVVSTLANWAGIVPDGWN